MFSLFHYPFIQNAFISGSLISIIAAVIGYFVLIRGLTFAGHALSEIGFSGAAGALIFGLDPIIGLLTFTICAGIAIGFLGKRFRERDLTIGIIMMFILGLGSLFITIYNGYAERAYSILFGTILGISTTDVLITALFTILVTVAIVCIFRPLLFSSFDPDVAEARGVPVQSVAIAFFIILAVTVALSVQVVGVLLIFTLLVGPAATAMRLVHEPFSAIALSIALGLLFTWLGILLAINTPIPVSFYIAALSFGVYLPVRIFSHGTQKRK